MVWTTKCMNSAIYVVVNINKYKTKFSLTKDVISVANGTIIVGCVVVVVVAVVGEGTAAPAVDVAMGASITANNNNAIGAIVPPPLTEEEEAHWWCSKARTLAHLRMVPANLRRARAAAVVVLPRGTQPWRPLLIQILQAMRSSLSLLSPTTWRQRAGSAGPSPLC